MSGYGGTLDDLGYSVRQACDGGFIVAGYTESFGAGYLDVYLIRTDPNGDTLWTKAYGKYDYDASYSIQETSDSGFIVTGATASGAGGGDVYLIRLTRETLGIQEYNVPYSSKLKGRIFCRNNYYRFFLNRHLLFITS